LRYFFEVYIREAKFRAMMDAGHFAELYVNRSFTTRDLKEVPAPWRKRIPEYIKDYVSLNPFM
jgi:type I restriction enzyme R subunit